MLQAALRLSTIWWTRVSHTVTASAWLASASAAPAAAPALAGRLVWSSACSVDCAVSDASWGSSSSSAAAAASSEVWWTTSRSTQASCVRGWFSDLTTCWVHSRTLERWARPGTCSMHSSSHRASPASTACASRCVKVQVTVLEEVGEEVGSSCAAEGCVELLLLATGDTHRRCCVRLNSNFTLVLSLPFGPEATL